MFFRAPDAGGAKDSCRDKPSRSDKKSSKQRKVESASSGQQLHIDLTGHVARVDTSAVTHSQPKFSKEGGSNNLSYDKAGEGKGKRGQFESGPAVDFAPAKKVLKGGMKENGKTLLNFFSNK